MLRTITKSGVLASTGSRKNPKTIHLKPNKNKSKSSYFILRKVGQFFFIKAARSSEVSDERRLS